MVRRKFLATFYPYPTSCDASPCRPSNVHQRTSHASLISSLENECNSDFANGKFALLSLDIGAINSHFSGALDSLIDTILRCSTALRFLPKVARSVCLWNFSTPCPMPWSCRPWCSLHARSKPRGSWGERSASDTAFGLCTGRMRPVPVRWVKNIGRSRPARPYLKHCKA